MFRKKLFIIFWGLGACPQNPEEGVKFPSAEVRSSYEPLEVSTGNLILIP